jgi:predicted metalloendopeptidase
MNDINFPAGVLQPPLYDPKMDDAPNYGNTGGTVGHELTHGFDDEGRQYDAVGNLEDWWTEGDAKKFKERAQKVVDQYNGFVAVDTLHVNGELTLGENLADLGGVTISFYAMQHALKGKSRELVDGFTPEQLFFLGYAHAWRSKIRPESARLRTLTDPHSPPYYRVNGPLSNFPEFAKAFGCKAGDDMVRDESLRVAAGLATRGLETGQHVAIMLPTSRDFFPAFLGTLYAGGIPVPIYPPARRSQLEEHLQRQSRILAN